MKRSRLVLATIASAWAWAWGAAAQTATGVAVPPGYWVEAESQPILDKTLIVRLAPDLAVLAPNERQAVDRLLEAGRILQRLYESSRHPQALDAHADLVALDAKLGSPIATRNLLRLYRIFQGPIATTLENRRLPFLPVDSIAPGKNVYWRGATKSVLDAHMESHPESRADLLHPRTVVRRSEPELVRRDLTVLRQHPAIEVLQPAVRQRLEALLAQAAPEPFYAVSYTVAYADDLLSAAGLLQEAAVLVQPTDAELARYLRHRSRDLLANDYEAGDTAWVTSTFGNLNAQIGSYESYDDELYGVKTFFGLSLLLRDVERSNALRAAIEGMQDFENSLPYAHKKKVREDIPVGVYEVIADFGQTRGTNTATILPNESYTARKFGRTILMRYNILTQPGLIANARQAWEAAVAPPFHADFASEGGFHRTLWHEIGHYLGVDRDQQGRELDDALEADSPTLEELKADLVSLYLGQALHRRRYYDAGQLRALYASGIGRTLQKSKPRRDQAYQTMQLMQMNYFLEKGLVRFDAATGRLHIDYARYHATVESLLRDVLVVQFDGDKTASNAFIERYTGWDEELHGRLAQSMRATEKTRFREVRYGALGE